jgi:hypothetical protein
MFMLCIAFSMIGCCSLSDLCIEISENPLGQTPPAAKMVDARRHLILGGQDVDARRHFAGTTSGFCFIIFSPITGLI